MVEELDEKVPPGIADVKVLVLVVQIPPEQEASAMAWARITG